MRSVRVWMVALIVCSVALAGCGDKDGKKTTNTVEEPEGNNISGVVVTPTIQPIPGAKVKILQTGEEDTTDLFGRFRFSDIDAGSYILEASAPGHDTTKLAIQVKDGETARPRIQLSPIQPPVARHQTLTFKGFIKSSFGPADEAVEPYKEQVNLAGCDCVFYFTVPRYTVALTLEAVWEEPFSPPPEAYDVSFNFDIQPLSLSHHTAVTQGSPVHAVLTGDSFTGDGPLDFSKAGSMTIMVSADELVPTTDQAFDVFLTIWEVDLPPDGWKFVTV